MASNLHTFNPNHRMTKKLTRGYFVNKDTLDLSYELTPTEYIFGKSPKDVVEFTVYNLDQEKLGWKNIEDTPLYENEILNYTDYNGDFITSTTQYLIKTIHW